MNKYSLFLSALFLFSINCNADLQSAAPTDGTEYPYVSFRGGRLDIKMNGSVLLGDYGVKAKICDEGSSYYCVNSDFFNFAVPRNLKTDSTKTWTVDTHTYQIVSPSRYVIIFGKEIDVTIISCSEHMANGDIAVTYFYYSSKLGLLGFENNINVKPGNPSHPGSDFPGVYISADPYGFGAAVSG